MTQITTCNVATAEIETINGDRGDWYKIHLCDGAGKRIAELAIFGAAEIAGDNLAPVKWTFDGERLNFPEPDCCTYHSTGGPREMSCGGDRAVERRHPTGERNERAAWYHRRYGVRPSIPGQFLKDGSFADAVTETAFVAAQCDAIAF